MRSARELQRLQSRSRANGGYTSYRPCSCCGLAVDPRNYRKHVKACTRRKRLAPDLWQEWWCDMRDLPDDDRRRPASDPLGRRA
jgi:hypothetical protein